MFRHLTVLGVFLQLLLCLSVLAGPLNRRRRDGTPNIVGTIDQGVGHENVNISNPRQILDLGKDEDIVSDDAMTLPDGEKLTSYVQEVNGFPVWGSETVVQEDRGEDVPFELANDGFDNDIDELAAPLFDKPLPSETISTNLCKTAHKVSEGPNTKYDYNTTRYIYHDEEAKTAIFADFVEIRSEEDPGDVYKCLVDATNGRVIIKFPGVEYAQYPGGNAKAGRRTVNVDAPTDPTTQKCVLTFSDGKIQTLSMKNTANQTSAQVVQFDCDKGPEDEINESYGPAIDCYDYIMKTQKCLADHAYFPDLYTLGPDNELRINIHYKTNFANAFWNGEGAFFGDGDASMYSTCSSLDTVAHEIGHALIGKFANLVPQSESGCIGEAFADMTAMMVRHCATGSTNWVFDMKVQKGDDSLLIDTARDLASSSTSDGVIKQYSDYMNDTEIHRCSGIYSHVFYKFASAEGWDIYRAYYLMFGAMRMFWSETMTMEEGICGVQQFADQLEFSSYDQDIISNAFASVGLQVPDDCEAVASKLKPEQQVNVVEEGAQGKSVNVYKLTNCVPIDGLSGETGSESFFKLTIPDGQKPIGLRVTLRTVPGDNNSNPDIRLKYGTLPTSSKDFDLGKDVPGGNVTMFVPNPKPGTYYIVLYGSGAYTDMTLTACKLFENFQVLIKALEKGR